jgi:hypothetical protein
MNIFQKIESGLKWFGKEVGQGIAALPRILKLAEDAEQVAQDALPKVMVVVKDAGNLADALAKDGGASMIALSALVAAATLAAAAKGINLAEDAAVIAAFKSFCGDFAPSHWQDVLTAIDVLATDTHDLDSTVIAGIKELEADA